LERIEPDLQQIRRQDDGGESVAEPACRAGGVEVEDVRPSACAQAFEETRATAEVRPLRQIVFERIGADRQIVAVGNQRWATIVDAR